MEAVTGLVGRDRELKAAGKTLAKGANLLVLGAAGIGKSAFLRALYNEQVQHRPVLWVSEGTAKEQAFELAWQTHEQVGLRVPAELVPNRYLVRAEQEGVHWRWIERSVRRMTVRNCIAMVKASLEATKEPVLVFVESLELSPSQVEYLVALLEVAQVAACMADTNRRERVRRLLWRFPEQERVQLQPLTREASREIAERWLAAHPVRFESERVRAVFLRVVEQESSGVPAAIRGMLEAAATEKAVTRGMVRGLSHEAGVRYIDMTPVLVLVLGALVAARYIARGTDSMELYVLAGVGLGLAVVVRFFVMPMMSRH